jgi:hypothetical protein
MTVSWRRSASSCRFDGFVAKYMGDGVLLYFGYPQAHEDDVERAVRAGLALIEAVGKLRVDEPLQVRVGIGTGDCLRDALVIRPDDGVRRPSPSASCRTRGRARELCRFPSWCLEL